MEIFFLSCSEQKKTLESKHYNKNNPEEGGRSACILRRKRKLILVRYGFIRSVQFFSTSLKLLLEKKSVRGKLKFFFLRRPPLVTLETLLMIFAFAWRGERKVFSRVPEIYIFHCWRGKYFPNGFTMNWIFFYVGNDFIVGEIVKSGWRVNHRFDFFKNPGNHQAKVSKSIYTKSFYFILSFYFIESFNWFILLLLELSFLFKVFKLLQIYLP